MQGQRQRVRFWTPESHVRTDLSPIAALTRITTRARLLIEALDVLWHDLRDAGRSLRATPGLTGAAILTLALGIGANTAIYSVVDSLFFRTLPVKEPQRLTLLREGSGTGDSSWSYPIWQEIQRRSDLFDGAGAWSAFNTRFTASIAGDTRTVYGIYASASLFPTLGVTPILGRTFSAADDRPGGDTNGPVAVISYTCWQRLFDGAADVVGRTLTLQGIPFTIVGVTPASFFGPEVGRSYDVAIPFGAEPLMHGSRESWLPGRTTWWLSIMLRTKPGQTADQATAVLRQLQPAIREATLPEQSSAGERAEYLRDPFTVVDAATGQSYLRSEYQRPLLALMIVVVLVLLVACANVANLLLARATARRHEWSVRLALGASRWRLVRQVFAECLLVTAIGGGVALAAAGWCSQLLLRLFAAESVALSLTLNWRVLAFAALVTVATAVMCAITPALRVGRGALSDVLKSVGRAGVESGRMRVADACVVAQVAISLALVVAAGLFLRTFVALAAAPLGFDADGVLLVDVNAQRAGIAPEDRLETYERIRQRVLALPGVASAAVSIVGPASGDVWSRLVDVSGSRIPPIDHSTGPEGFGRTQAPLPANEPLTAFNAVTPGWLTTYGMRLLAGRDISDADRANAARVALVNEAFARKFLNGANPIGHTVRALRENVPPAREIVGVVGDSVYRNVREQPMPAVYIPLLQSMDDGPLRTPPQDVTLAVRARSGSPAALTKGASVAIAAVDRDLMVSFRTMTDRIGAGVAQERALALLSAFFGALALLLAGIGLYAVMSYAVTRRRPEIAVRIAVGASYVAVVRLILQRAALIAAAGIFMGLGITIPLVTVLRSLLFGVAPRDPVTLGGAVTVLALTALVAAFRPAHRAATTDPNVALRAQ
jgi:predicted permease